MNSFFKTIKSLLGATNEADAPLDLQETIRQFVLNAQLEEALDLLIQTGNKEAQLLKKRLLDAQQQARIGQLNYSGFNVINNGVAHDILNIIEPPEQKEKLKSNEVEPPIEHILVNKRLVQALISNGKTEQVLVLLQKSGYPEVTALYDTLKAHKRRLNLGLLEDAEWRAFQKELHEKIVALPYTEDTTPQKILSARDKRHILQLLESSKTKEALHFGKGFGNDFFLLLGSYNQIVNNSKMGLIGEADKQQQLEAINTAIRHLIA